MTFADLSTFYYANQALLAGVGALTSVGLLLMIAKRLRAMKESRATLLVANILTIVAAALATMVSASGMWKFFTAILGATPLRIAFFAFIEIALFASALLARSRLLRDPQKGSTGIDGVAVWILAALTATLSALDSDTFREVCLRLVAPLVAAWMWERALAAERNVRLGTTARRINWAVTPERIFIWLHLADASDRDVSQADRTRRRAKLGRARLHLHLLQSRNAFAWRVRHAHRKVVKQAMQAAEHIGLADFPDAANERQAVQMYMATLYGLVDATSPQAVAHLNAWRTDPGPLPIHATEPTAEAAARNSNAADNVTTAVAHGVNGSKALAPLAGHARVTGTSQAVRVNEPAVAAAGHAHRPAVDGVAPQAPSSSAARQDSTDALNGNRVDEASLSAVASMRQFWDRQVATGRVPTGAELSRAAGVPPTTGLGRRKRREWATELPIS